MTTITITKTYFAGKTLGVCFSVDGRKAASLVRGSDAVTAMHAAFAGAVVLDRRASFVAAQRAAEQAAEAAAAAKKAAAERNAAAMAQKAAPAVAVAAAPKASFAKLNGVWCVVGSACGAGRTVQVAKKNGETKTVVCNVMIGVVRGQAHWMFTDATPSRHHHDDTCAECGERRGVIECTDASGLVGMCCRRCASYSRFERSFG